jgi:hypothetical protein
MDALLKLGKLTVRLLILPGVGLDERHLPLNLFQLLLCFLGCVHGLGGPTLVKYP